MYCNLHHGILPIDFITRIQRYIITATIFREISIGNHASSINNSALSHGSGVINECLFCYHILN
jgi:hypothetical protein